MDLPCSYNDFRSCLQDLDAINLVTLGYRPTLQWLSRLLLRGKVQRSVHIVDVGCGGGDMLRRVARWAKQNAINVRLTGIDLNPYAAAVARENSGKADGIEWVTGDAFSYTGHVPVDVVISSLFTHHLPDNDVIQFLHWMEQRARLGWFVNDLHRKPRPYHLFRVLAKMARWHRFVQHDGPLSIRRSFDWGDWRRFCHLADVPDARIEAFRPARLCVGRIKEPQTA